MTTCERGWTERWPRRRSLGALDAAAIERVCEEAWPRALNADELHEALLLLGVMTDEEVQRCLVQNEGAEMQSLIEQRRAGRSMRASGRSLPNRARTARPRGSRKMIRASAPQELLMLRTRAVRSGSPPERLPLIRAVYPGLIIEPPLAPPAAELERTWERSDAIRELLRGRMEVVGPITATQLADLFQLPQTEIDAALLGLESEGFVLRGKFHPGATGSNGATGGC